MSASSSNTGLNRSLPTHEIVSTSPSKVLRIGGMLPGLTYFAWNFFKKDFSLWPNLAALGLSLTGYKMSGLLCSRKKAEIITQESNPAAQKFQSDVAALRNEILKGGEGNIDANKKSYSARLKALANQLDAFQRPKNVLQSLQMIRTLLVAKADTRPAAFKALQDFHKTETAAKVKEVSQPRLPSAPKSPKVPAPVEKPTKHKLQMTQEEREERIIMGNKTTPDGKIVSANERFKIKVRRTTETAIKAGAKETKPRQWVEFYDSRQAVNDQIDALRVQKKQMNQFDFEQVDAVRVPLPTTEKGPAKARYQFACATHPGSKEPNEDKSIHKVSGKVRIGKFEFPYNLFGICDGHGGDDKASTFVSQNFAKTFENNLKLLMKDVIVDEVTTNRMINNALIKTFVGLNNEIYKLKDKNGEFVKSGTVVNVGVIINHHLFIAHAGDSRSFLVRNGKLVSLSKDHKPREQEESIKARGGFIGEKSGRVGTFKPGTGEPIGVLACARTLGDRIMQHHISSRPSISMVPLKLIPKGSFLVFGCDGNFDFATTKTYSDGIAKCASNSLEDLAYQMVGSAVVGQYKASAERLRRVFEIEEDKCDNTTGLIVLMPEYDPELEGPRRVSCCSSLWGC